MKEKISITLEEKTLEKIDSVVDLIFIRNRSQAIEHLVNAALGENRTAVILAGGKEEESLIEKDIYRITATIKGKSVVERSVQVLRENGFKTIFIIARHKILTKVFEILRDGSSFGVKINYVEEKESKGTAETLKLVKGKINSQFLVVYGDIIFDKINIEEIWKSHLKSNSDATLLLTTSPVPSEKGTVKMEGNKILEFVQKPKQSDIYLVFSPMFVAEPDMLNYEGSSLEKDVFPELATRGLLTGHLSSEKEIHIHKKEDLRRIA
jgi:NDP-sugar pyrophosphorylase family protein